MNVKTWCVYIVAFLFLSLPVFSDEISSNPGKKFELKKKNGEIVYITNFHKDERFISFQHLSAMRILKFSEVEYIKEITIGTSKANEPKTVFDGNAWNLTGQKIGKIVLMAPTTLTPESDPNYIPNYSGYSGSSSSSASSGSSGRTFVRSHTRSDGTHVSAYTRRSRK